MLARAPTAGSRLDELCKKQGLSLEAALRQVAAEEAQRAKEEAEAKSRTRLTDDELRKLLGDKKQVELALRAKVAKRNRTQAQLDRENQDVRDVADKLALLEARERRHKEAEAKIEQRNPMESSETQ